MEWFSRKDADLLIGREERAANSPMARFARIG
jgi:hypothetical protein